MAQDRPSAQPSVKIDNPRTRVTEWRFAPGAETGHHRHEYDYVVVPLATGRLRIVAPDGTESVAELTLGEPAADRRREHEAESDSRRHADPCAAQATIASMTATSWIASAGSTRTAGPPGRTAAR